MSEEKHEISRVHLHCSYIVICIDLLAKKKRVASPELSIGATDAELVES